VSSVSRSGGIPPPYGIIRRLLNEGRVVPFLGAGASMLGRPTGSNPAAWDLQAPFLPSGWELAHFLADEAAFPSDDPYDRDDLAKVASYYVDIGNRTMLKDCLRTAFERPSEIGPLHRLLASVEAPLVIVSTNYDTLVERALQEAGKPYDLVVYPADQNEIANAVLWWPHGATQPEIEETSTLSIDLDTTTVVFKMHGSVAPGEDDELRNQWASFVITEEDYVEFIFRMTNEAAIPATFFTHFLDRSFLFLGYGLRDWNLRVVLRSLKSMPGRPASDDRPDWAIQKAPSLLEQELWRKRGVHIFDVPIDEFVTRLQPPAA
jgi:hypothetical protein